MSKTEFTGMHLFDCALVGLGVTAALVWITEYYTSTAFRPVRSIAKASETGHGTNVIQGLAVSLESTALPVVVIAVGIYLAFHFAGLYGIALAATTMLALAGMIVALTQTLAAHGINYQQRLHVTGEDISPVSVHMAYIQLTLLHVPALIHRRNSLTMETFDTWPTPAHVLDAWDTRLRATDLARQLHALIGTTPPATDDDDGQTPTEPATTTAPVRVTPITLDEAS